MIPRETIQKILELAVYAPSGGNSQPWRFEVIDDKRVAVIALPERENAILNYRDHGTLIAHGALIETIILAANAKGYLTSVEYFPKKNRPLITAYVSFELGAQKIDPLAQYIKDRASNRKPFKNDFLSQQEKQQLISSIAQFSQVEIRLVEKKDNFPLIANALSIHQRLTLSNRELHKSFCSEIVWSQEEELKHGGLFIKTLELDAKKEKAVKLFRHWNLLRILNIFGIAKVVAKDTAGRIINSAILGTILIGEKGTDFLDAGRALQRLWLEATRLNLGFQLLAGLPPLWQRIQGKDAGILNSSEQNLVKTAYADLVSCFFVPSHKLIPFCFRIGHDSLPSARSSRRAPEISGMV